MHFLEGLRGGSSLSFTQHWCSLARCRITHDCVSVVRIAYPLSVSRLEFILRPLAFIHVAAGHALLERIQDFILLSTHHGWSVGYHLDYCPRFLIILSIHYAETHLNIAAGGGDLNVCSGKRALRCYEMAMELMMDREIATSNTLDDRTHYRTY